MDKSIIRQQVLSALRPLGGAPGSEDYIVSQIPCSNSPSVRAAIETALGDLATLGYLEDLAAGTAWDSQYRITASGLRQINREERMDPSIWGAAALGARG